jgi:hypothetical protein
LDYSLIIAWKAKREKEHPSYKLRHGESNLLLHFKEKSRAVEGCLIISLEHSMLGKITREIK